MNDGSGASLAEAGGKGPAIAVGGTTTGAWANAGWFTPDAAGNTLKLAGNPYIDGLIDMTTEGEMLMGLDYYVTTWPSATETLWGLHRSDLAGGGLRCPLTAAGAGRFSTYYKPAGGGETELAAITTTGFLSVRNSMLWTFRSRPSRGELQIGFYRNGRMERSTVHSLGAPPPRDAAGGITIAGYGGASPTQKLGTFGVGTRIANFYLLRHSGIDRNIAGRLSAHFSANQAFPSWLVRV